jgi:hypothetical protein
LRTWTEAMAMAMRLDAETWLLLAGEACGCSTKGPSVVTAAVRMFGGLRHVSVCSRANKLGRQLV